MKIALGSDKSGFSLKEAIKTDLIEQGYSVTGSRLCERR